MPQQVSGGADGDEPVGVPREIEEPEREHLVEHFGAEVRKRNSEYLDLMAVPSQHRLQPVHDQTAASRNERHNGAGDDEFHRRTAGRLRSPAQIWRMAPAI